MDYAPEFEYHCNITYAFTDTQARRMPWRELAGRLAAVEAWEEDMLTYDENTGVGGYQPGRPEGFDTLYEEYETRRRGMLELLVNQYIPELLGATVSYDQFFTGRIFWNSNYYWQ